MDLKTGLFLEKHGDALILRAANPFPSTSPEEGLGCAGYHGPAKTMEQMDGAIGDTFRRDWGKDDSDR